jgi:hypothetical protein
VFFSLVPLHSKAALGNSLVSLSLGGKLRRSSGGVHADIDLSVNNVNVQGSEAAENSLESRLAGQGTRSRSGLLGKVGLVTTLSVDNQTLAKCEAYLEANTIDLHTVALDELDDALSSNSLVTVVLKVVVVVE